MTKEIPEAIILVTKGYAFTVTREGRWVTFHFPDATEEDAQAYFDNAPLPCRSVIEAHRTVRIAMRPR